MRRFTELSWSWRSTRSRVLSVAAGALVSVASLAAPSYAGIVTFGSDGNTFNASQALQITKDTRGTAKPATSVSWNEAARFVNWLNTSTGHQAAYKFADGSAVNVNIQLWTSGEAGYDVNNKYRNSLAKYVLPSYNEWYKAAYYNPTNSTYYDFPNGSDTRPTAVTGGTGPNTAVYTQSGEASPTGPADVDQAGGLSPYGVMGLGGNAREWQESSFDLANSSVSSSRGFRGGSWLFAPGNLSSRNLPNNDPSFEFYLIGFRVAMVQPVPEPSMMVIEMVFGLGGLAAKRRMKK
jgi:sulfatase modifying factor 1